MSIIQLTQAEYTYRRLIVTMSHLRDFLLSPRIKCYFSACLISRLAKSFCLLPPYDEKNETEINEHIISLQSNTTYLEIKYYEGNSQWNRPSIKTRNKKYWHIVRLQCSITRQYVDNMCVDCGRKNTLLLAGAKWIFFVTPYCGVDDHL